MGSRRRNLIVLGLVLALVAVSIWAVASKPTRQGIDLAGGTELVYQGTPTPANQNISAEDIDRAVDIVRDRVDALGVSEPEITRIGEDQLAISLPEVQNAQDAIDQVGETSQLSFYDFEPNVIAPNPKLPSAAERPFNRLYDAVIASQDEKPECFEKSGEPICTHDGLYYLFDEQTLELLAGPVTREEDLFLKFGGEQPEGSVVEEVPQGYVVLREEPPADDPATEADESETGLRGFFLMRDRPELTGDDIRNPEQQFDQVSNTPNVTFDFTDEGRRAFSDVTERIAQRGQERANAALGVQAAQLSAEDASQYSDSFAVALDGEIVSKPIINFVENPSGIDGRTGAQISGDFTINEAQDLAEFLRIGALPVELTLINQSTVSATLGQEALEGAILAGLAGLVLVVLFLLAYYRVLGLVAALGLAVYALFYLAMIKIIPITLTLPGLAGLILTVGVAADSNIVIFERIKEELRLGRSTLSAIAQGYRKGIATIIDANVITLLTAFILFVLASAGVKGFAFTLGIGTIVSLFTAVLFTQAFLAVMGRSRLLRSNAFLGAGERQVEWNFDFSGLSKYFFAASGVILVIGAVAFSTKQLNLGIDFESGTRIKAALVDEASAEDVRAALTDADIEGAESAEIQAVEDEEFGANVIQIQAKIPPDQAPQVQEVLSDSFNGLEGGEQGFQNQSVGPTFGQQVAKNAVRALILSLIVISIYVAIRFEAKYAVPVLIALAHDILITGGIYALTGLEVSSATVAAFLTILGYSMYDTIIVFDRIRENVPRMPRAAFTQIVNRSMSEVLTRSLITGLSTVFLVTMLLIFGDETLRGFAFAMIVGIASGTYSSIFIAGPVLTEWKEREPQYRARRHHIEETMGYVPVFPEDNVVARVEGHSDEVDAPKRRLIEGGPGVATEVPADATDASPPTGAPETGRLPSDGDERSEAVTGQPGAAETDGAGADGHQADPAVAQQKAAERQRRRQRQKRRKHGRNR
ncbi:MAG TPA: protein translocase subunit SecD [Solirubrobacterales bacterium]|nr:protein translocase subunit SecD [Solirubrobacterales bacterium]